MMWKGCSKGDEHGEHGKYVKYRISGGDGYGLVEKLRSSVDKFRIGE